MREGKERRKYANRGCGWIATSGTYQLLLTLLFGSSFCFSVPLADEGEEEGEGGIARKSPTPRNGKHDMLTIRSFGARIEFRNVRRDDMSLSTFKRSQSVPPNGEEGVDSIMYRAYSGCHFPVVSLLIR